MSMSPARRDRLSDHNREPLPVPATTELVSGPYGMSWEMCRLPDGSLPSLQDWEELVMFYFMTTGDIDMRAPRMPLRSNRQPIPSPRPATGPS